MAGPKLSEPNYLAVLWRRKWIAIATFVLVVAVSVAVSKALTPIYSTTATLIIAQPGTSQSLDTALATEEAARSFAQVLSGTDFAREVAAALGHGATADSVSSATTIQSVPSTELITITSESPQPLRAQQIANAYARVFVGFAPRLTPQTKATVTSANRATLPKSPVRPKPVLYALVAAVLGLALGIALAFLRERFDVRVRSLEEVTGLVDLPVLATIPVRGPRNQSAFTDAFRLLRTTLKFLDTDEDHKRFAITSWSESEGKTTIAYELALVMGTAGGRTLLIDGDTHRAGLRRLVDPDRDPHDGPGLSDYILGASPLPECLHQTALTDVTFVPPGRAVASLANLLESPRGSAALESLGESADVVIIDCPPLAASADASSLATKVDGVILVIDLRKATSVSIGRALTHLQTVGANVVGVVVNRDSQAVSLNYYYAQKPAAKGTRLRRGGRRRANEPVPKAEQSGSEGRPANPPRPSQQGTPPLSPSPERSQSRTSKQT